MELDEHPMWINDREHGTNGMIPHPPSPDLLLIGHITRDLAANGSYSLGGTAAYAAVTAQRLGLTPAIVTRANLNQVEELRKPLRGIEVEVRPAAATTTFVNRYHAARRTQFQRGRAEDLQPEDVPQSCKEAPIVLLCPVSGELGAEMVDLFPQRTGRIIAATPQGWMRTVHEDGQVEPAPWRSAERILGRLDAAILSEDDLQWYMTAGGGSAEAVLDRWSSLVPLLVVTAGAGGATLFYGRHRTHHPACPAAEVDPTGAGDVFAAAFLTRLHRGGDPHQAAIFANCAASLSIGGVGISAIPTLDQVEEKFSQSAHRLPCVSDPRVIP